MQKIQNSLEAFLGEGSGFLASQASSSSSSSSSSGGGGVPGLADFCGAEICVPRSAAAFQASLQPVPSPPPPRQEAVELMMAEATAGVPQHMPVPPKTTRLDDFPLMMAKTVARMMEKDKGGGGAGKVRKSRKNAARNRHHPYLASRGTAVAPPAATNDEDELVAAFQRMEPEIFDLPDLEDGEGNVVPRPPPAYTRLGKQQARERGEQAAMGAAGAAGVTGSGGAAAGAGFNFASAGAALAAIPESDSEAGEYAILTSMGGLHGIDEGVPVPLRGKTFRVGRRRKPTSRSAVDLDLAIDAKTVSTLHCTFLRMRDDVVLQDTSTNGTFIDMIGSMKRIGKGKSVILPEECTIMLGKRGELGKLSVPPSFHYRRVRHTPAAAASGAASRAGGGLVGGLVGGFVGGGFVGGGFVGGGGGGGAGVRSFEAAVQSQDAAERKREVLREMFARLRRQYARIPRAAPRAPRAEYSTSAD